LVSENKIEFWTILDIISGIAISVKRLVISVLKKLK